MIHRTEVTRPISSTPGAVFSVLADCEAYPEWCPEVISARLLAREGDVAIVEIGAPALARQPLVLEMVQTFERSVMFTQVDRYRTQGLAGRLELSAGDAGRTLVRGELAIGAAFFRIGCRRRLRQVLEGVLEALADRVGPGEARAEPPAEGRTLLEVRRTPAGLEVLVGPQRFRFPEAGPR